MPKIKRIDHIGIAVPDMKEALVQYKSLLFQEPSHFEVLEASKIEIAFFDIGGVQIELLAPTESDSKLRGFLREKGGGLHHICYEVENLHRILEILKENKIKLIDEKPRSGSRNSKIGFVDPVSSKGVLIEYCEFVNSDPKAT